MSSVDSSPFSWTLRFSVSSLDRACSGSLLEPDRISWILVTQKRRHGDGYPWCLDPQVTQVEIVTYALTRHCRIPHDNPGSEGSLESKVLGVKAILGTQRMMQIRLTLTQSEFR